MRRQRRDGRRRRGVLGRRIINSNNLEGLRGRRGPRGRLARQLGAPLGRRRRQRGRRLVDGRRLVGARSFGRGARRRRRHGRVAKERCSEARRRRLRHGEGVARRGEEHVNKRLLRACSRPFGRRRRGLRGRRRRDAALAVPCLSFPSTLDADVRAVVDALAAEVAACRAGRGVVEDHGRVHCREVVVRFWCALLLAWRRGLVFWRRGRRRARVRPCWPVGCCAKLLAQLQFRRHRSARAQYALVCAYAVGQQVIVWPR